MTLQTLIQELTNLASDPNIPINSQVITHLEYDDKIEEKTVTTVTVSIEASTNGNSFTKIKLFLS